VARGVKDVYTTRLTSLLGRYLGKDTRKPCTLGGKTRVYLNPSSNSFLAQGYQRAGLVTSEELALIKKVDRQPRAKAEAVLLSDGQSYALLYLRLLKKLQRIDTMQLILVLITDALSGLSPLGARFSAEYFLTQWQSMTNASPYS
jgi:hypothetical protein